MARQLRVKNCIVTTESPLEKCQRKKVKRQQKADIFDGWCAGRSQPLEAGYLNIHAPLCGE